MKRPARIFAVGLTLLCAIVVAGSFYMLDYSLTPERIRRSVETRLSQLFASYPYVRPWLDSLQRHHALLDTVVYQRSGERHHALYIYAPRPTNKVAVLVHGYKDRAVGMLKIAYIYQRMGYHVLLPDLHAHGTSEGNDIQMGWKERFDVMRWQAVADSIFRDSTGTTQQVLHGISMGAATTMCVSGEQTAPYVKCFVEDCGYTSAWDEFRNELKARFSLPPFPLLYTTSWLCKLRYGWSFAEASPLNQVKKCTKPMLFLHGGIDDFVHTDMVYRLYSAKPAPKELWVWHGSAHDESLKKHPREYMEVVEKFVGRYIH